MAIRLERLQTTPYKVNYKQPNGVLITYSWQGAKDYAKSIVEVDDTVYEWLKYNTSCFQKKKLVVVDEEQKKDMENVLTEEELQTPVYSLEEIKNFLNGTSKELKAVVDTLSDDQVTEFINVAKQIKLDSSTKRNVLAKKIKMPVEIVFAEE